MVAERVFSAIDRWRMAAASIRWMAFAFCFGLAEIDRWMVLAVLYGDCSLDGFCAFIQRLLAGWLLRFSSAIDRRMAFAIYWAPGNPTCAHFSFFPITHKVSVMRFKD